MSLLTVPVVGKIISTVTGIIDKTVEDKDQAAKLKADLQTQLLQGDFSVAEKELDARMQVLVAEAKGESVLQRNWRPILMLTFTYIIAHNFIFAPIIQSFGYPLPTLAIPPDLWGLLKLGLGGYVLARSGEKMVQAWAGTK
jgi:hypothetical protein